MDMPADQQVIFKLTLPEENGFYGVLVAHPRVMRVVALSGGYSRDQANDRLAHNPGVIASFSRALTEGLTAQQSDERVRRSPRRLDQEHLRRVHYLVHVWYGVAAPPP